VKAERSPLLSSIRMMDRRVEKSDAEEKSSEQKKNGIQGLPDEQAEVTDFIPSISES